MRSVYTGAFEEFESSLLSGGEEKFAPVVVGAVSNDTLEEVDVIDGIAVGISGSLDEDVIVIG